MHPPFPCAHHTFCPHVKGQAGVGEGGTLPLVKAVFWTHAQSCVSSPEDWHWPFYHNRGTAGPEKGREALSPPLVSLSLGTGGSGKGQLPI